MLHHKLIKAIRVATLLAAVLLIGAQFALGEVPPLLAYPLLFVLGGGAIFLEGHKMWEGYKRAQSRSPEEGRQTLIITVVMLVVIGVVGFLFIRS